MLSLSADVGGTFTDFVLVDSTTGELFADKVPSTPSSTEAITQGIEHILAQAGLKARQVDRFVHGFTIATNAFLTHRGARVALVVTEGFRDILEIGGQSRPELYSLTQNTLSPLVPRSRVIEVKERVDAFGNVVKALSGDEATSVAKRVAALDPQAIAISLLFAQVNAAHEKQLAAALKTVLPHVPVYLSSHINPQAQEFPRTYTTVTAAYVGPVVDAYLAELERTLPRLGVVGPLLLMRSDGGIATARAARANPGNMLLSGPAGGVIASVDLSKRLGVPNIITFDMGGTSADFSLIHGSTARKASGRSVGGDSLRLPSLDIETISAGGGSIGRVDIGGAIRIGPDSAGSVPGPACYGRGGTAPTLTDAALILGILDARDYLGGDMPLDVDKARAAIEIHVARPLSVSVEDAALGMVAVANAQMAEAIRGLSLERGHDLREFALLAFGGAGPMFAPFLARDLGMAETILPRRPGVFCAFGLQLCDIRHIAQTPFQMPLAEVDVNDLEAAFRKMTDELAGALDDDSVSKADRVFQCAADVRYIGQFHELTLPLDVGDPAQPWDAARRAARFHEAHARAYGFSDSTSPCEFVNLRAEAIGIVPKPELVPRVPTGEVDPPSQPVGRRKIYLENGYCDCAVYRRDDLRSTDRIRGPAIITQRDSTVLVLPDQEARVDQGDVLRISQPRQATR